MSCNLDLLTDSDWLQIEMAAKGAVSGTSDDWPLLVKAIEKVTKRKLMRKPAAWLRGFCEGLVMARDDRASECSAATDCLTDYRAVLVRLKASPAGLRRIAAMLEDIGEGKSIRVNWYTSQIEFVHCTDISQTAIG
jgi:hypothetical protein